MSDAQNDLQNNPRNDPRNDPEDGPVTDEAATTRDLPDLGAVDAKIHQAEEAQDHLTDVMPGAIQPDDDAYEGMSGPTEGDVEETDETAETGDEREARSPQQPTAQQVQDEVTNQATGEDTTGETTGNSGRS